MVGDEAAGGNGSWWWWITLTAGGRYGLVGQTVAGARAVNGADGRVGRSEGTGARVDEAVVDVVFPVVGGGLLETAIAATFTVATQVPYFATFDAHLVTLDERTPASRALSARWVVLLFAGLQYFANE